MAEKFGNFRWVKEGYLDNRVAGTVVGQITLAGVGPVDVCLRGDCTGEIAGKAIRFQNSNFFDDAIAAEVLADFAIPQIGQVSLISFDPHPLLPPHPYIEWFSDRKAHYRIELALDDAWTLQDDEARSLDSQSQALRDALMSDFRPRATASSEEQEWF